MRTTSRADVRPSGVPARRDPGVSFIELLVAVVLMGTAVIAILTAVRATLIASRIDSEQAKAYTWLQSASDALRNAPRQPCAVPVGSQPEDSAAGWTDNKAMVTAAYSAVLDLVTPPSGWSASDLTLESVEYLGRSTTDPATFEWSPEHCYEGAQDIAGVEQDFRSSPLLSQRLVIRVVSPDSKTDETLTLVKGSP